MPTIRDFKYADYEVYEDWTAEGIQVRVQLNSETETIAREAKTGTLWLPLHRETAVKLVKDLQAAIDKYDMMDEDYAAAMEQPIDDGNLILDPPLEISEAQIRSYVIAYGIDGKVKEIIDV